jgi:glycosyltransferase involved in cell wall biosynthesis
VADLLGKRQTNPQSAKADGCKLRVGVYADMDSRGGEYQYALCVVQALASNPDFDTVCYGTRRVWADTCKNLGIPYRRPIDIPALGKAIARLIRPRVEQSVVPRWFAKAFAYRLAKDDCDVCVFPTPSTLVSGMPCVTIGAIHDLMYSYERRFRDVDGFREDAYYEKLFSTMMRDADVVIVDSPLGAQHVRETIVEGLIRPADERLGIVTREAQLTVLPFCAPRYVDDYLTGMRNNAEAMIQKIRPEILQLAEQPYLFYPAMIRPDKNHLNLIRAMGILKSQGVETHALFTGDPGLMEQMLTDEIKQQQLEDCISFVSYVDDEELCYLFQHAQAMVMPTLAGPTNIPQLEAFALGCPVLTSDIYAMSWQIGDAGILFDPESPEDIADAIHQVWLNDSKRTELIGKGYQRRSEYSFEVFANRYAQVIQTSARRTIPPTSPLTEEHQ